MALDFQNAFIAGFESVAAWSDVLDEINVFPIADGDTGRNLTISLTPLRYPDKDRETTIRKLLQHARGNSGNIAARFFAGFIMIDSGKVLLHAAKEGRELAWKAVHNPQPGTMLTVFDALVEFLDSTNFECTPEYISRIVEYLETAVKKTPEILPRLKSAGVVDSGALGIYIFLKGFFYRLADRIDNLRPITEIFEDLLKVSPAFQENRGTSHCVDTVIRFENGAKEKMDRLSEYDGSMVIIHYKDYLKVHLHTDNTQAFKAQAEALGEVVKWSDDNIDIQIENFKRPRPSGAVHIITDAAGSVTREDARGLGITLLDSYITAGNQSFPETRFPPSELYQLMRNGVKVSTSQASVFERHQYYHRVIHQYPRVLYLCVGSAFTGNYHVATAWKQKNDPDDRFTIIDTQAASGRLGTIVIATARFAAKSREPEAVVEFAKKTVLKSQEYVFLDKLKYLAAGGRISKSGAFLGDMFLAKPVISPVAEGAKKVGMVKNAEGQIKFAHEKLAAVFNENSAPFIMLEYSDNYAWVSAKVKKEIETRYPLAEIRLQPFSLTSGAHMGPGTWGIAFTPEMI